MAAVNKSATLTGNSSLFINLEDGEIFTFRNDNEAIAELGARPKDFNPNNITSSSINIFFPDPLLPDFTL